MFLSWNCFAQTKIQEKIRFTKKNMQFMGIFPGFSLRAKIFHVKMISQKTDFSREQIENCSRKTDLGMKLSLIIIQFLMNKSQLVPAKYHFNAW